MAAVLGTWLGLSIQNTIPKGVTPEKYYDIKINTTGANTKTLNALENSYGIKYGVEDIFGSDYLSNKYLNIYTTVVGKEGLVNDMKIQEAKLIFTSDGLL